mmetsp:Transcript_15175/g.37806  ORF Transcript_15175/g.37806 Transcript_15175/m.37806 type:complete len:379 (-) Transcript_15175:256-1392(-)
MLLPDTEVGATAGPASCCAATASASGMSGAGATSRPRYRCRSIRYGSSSRVRIEYAVPDRPMRAARPTRCTNSSGLAGKSRLMTLWMSGMSIPRAATSVVMSRCTLAARNLATWILRAVWSMLPYTQAACMPSLAHSAARYSTWWRVAANRMVSWSPGTTSRSRCSSAATLSSLRTVKNARPRSGEILRSVSSCTSCGDDRPARAKSASVRGSVAENSSVCRRSLMRARMSEICSENPISHSLSASSITQYSTVLSDMPCTSARWCSRRPGVATMTSGLLASSAHCASSASPPTSTAVRRSVKRANSRTALCVCSVSSRVGASSTARAPARGECAFSLSIMGMTNAAVFPEPVRAMPITSTPCRMRGSVRRWMGVGRR